MKIEIMTPDELARRFEPTTVNEQVLHEAIVSLLGDIALAKSSLKRVIEDLPKLC